MNEEKNNSLEPEVTEEVTETTEEVAETAEVTEEVAEVVETAAEEISETVEAEEVMETEEIAETEEAVDGEADSVLEEADETAEYGEVVAVEEEVKKKLPKGVLIAIIAAAVIFVGLIVASTLMGDKYSRMYTDVTGVTAGEVADQLGMDFDDFVEYYDLPKGVTSKTHEYAVINLMPASTYIEKVLGTTYEVAHEFFGWDDSITGETPIGEAWNKTPLTKYYGEAYVEEVKTLYGLDESVTGETLYGEVREQIEKAMLEQRLAEEAAATEEAAETTEEAATEEAAAETEADEAAEEPAE